MIRAVSSYAVLAFTSRKERKFCVDYPTVNDYSLQESCGKLHVKGPAPKLYRLGPIFHSPSTISVVEIVNINAYPE